MNGTMKYTRRVNLGNYEHEEFTADIPYDFSPDDDYLVSKGKIDRARDLAVETAEIALGLRPTTADNVASVKAALTKAAAVINAPITTAEVEKASKPVLHLVEEQPAPVEIADDDGVIVTVAEPVQLMTNGEATALSVPESSSFDVAAPVDAEITYDDLYNLANGWVTGTDVPGARSRRTTAFQKLMRKYATQLSAIPQDRRPAFVAELAELQKRDAVRAVLAP